VKNGYELPSFLSKICSSEFLNSAEVSCELAGNAVDLCPKGWAFGDRGNAALLAAGAPPCDVI